MLLFVFLKWILDVWCRLNAVLALYAVLQCTYSLYMAADPKDDSHKAPLYAATTLRLQIHGWVYRGDNPVLP